MAKEFNQEMTIYLWPIGNPYYPVGHAAFKVNNGSEKKFFNYLIDAETRDEIELLRKQSNRSNMYTRTRPLEQRLRENEVEKRMVEHTAPLKFKIPFIGTSGWGILLWNGMLAYEHTAASRASARSSCGYVAALIESACADAYAQPPYSTMLRWDTPILERWARAIRQRIDDLNRKSEQVDQFCSAHFTLSKEQFSSSLMTATEWKNLCNQYWGSLLIHSGRRKKLDKLVQEHASTKNRQREAIRNLAEILDICMDYLATDYKQGNATHAIPVLKLGKQVNKIVETGLHAYRAV